MGRTAAIWLNLEIPRDFAKSILPSIVRFLVCQSLNVGASSFNFSSRFNLVISLLSRVMIIPRSLNFFLYLWEARDVLI
jgi:hypothetical protein